MTRVMYWNVLKCGTNALFPPMNGKRKRLGEDDPDYGTPAAYTDAQARLGVLTNAFNAVNPDIFAIVELTPGAGPPAEGQPVADSSAMKLLARLRATAPVGRNYRLVPPLVSGTGGKAEGVAVIFDAARLRFVGPFGWSGAAADTVANLGGAAALAPYGAPWGPPAGLQALPNRSTNTWANGGAGPVLAPWLPQGCTENVLAGQWSYVAGAGGAAVNFAVAGNRRPFQTAFIDTTGAAARLVRLITCHLPPQTRYPPGATLNAQLLNASAAPRAAVAQLAGLADVAGPIAATEVRCVIGDFNISAWDAVSAPTSLALLTAAGYTQQLDPIGDGAAAQWPDYGYYATHVVSTAQADPFVGASAGPPPVNVRGYPGFGYVSTYGGPGNWYDAIDHAFTRTGGAAVPSNFTIANPVTGSPYNAGVAPPANVHQGTIVSNGSVPFALFGYPPGIYADDPNADDRESDFKEWGAYSTVRSLSDHLPLALDI